MDYITRFDYIDASIHIYKQQAFFLTNDNLRKIINVDRLANIDERHKARTALADALAFIYGWCVSTAHIISQEHKSWKDFFDTCFIDMSLCQPNGQLEMLCKVQRELRQYEDIFVPYVSLRNETCSAKTLLIHMAVLIISALC